MLFARFWMVNPGARNEIVCDIGFSRWVAQYEDYMRDQIMAKQLALVNLDDQHHRSKLLADITAKSRPDLISDCSEADEQDSDHETRPEEWKRPYVEPAVKQKLTKYVPPKKVFHEKPRQVFNGPEVDEWKSVPYPSELIEAADDGSADYGVGATAAAKAAQTAATGRPAGGAWGTWSGDTAKTRDQWKAFMELKHKR